MDEKLLDPETFPYDRFLATMEERDQWIGEWAQGKHPRDVPVLIFPSWDMWNDNSCGDRRRFLGKNLWGMATSAEWTSDGVFPHLQPWYGVGLYASAFGCDYIWEDQNSPQTRPVFSKADQVADITMPQPGRSQPMQEVLDRIRWYRKVTGDRLPICLTDTQSPCDTASLLMETNEYFAVGTSEPERLQPLHNAITNLIIAFSEMQMDAIGPNVSLPGHQMVCHRSFSGISDRLAVQQSDRPTLRRRRPSFVRADQPQYPGDETRDEPYAGGTRDLYRRKGHRPGSKRPSVVARRTSRQRCDPQGSNQQERSGVVGQSSGQ